MNKSAFRFFLCVLFAVVPLSALAAEPGKGDSHIVKGGIKSIVSGVVSTGKDAITGVAEGLDSGRQEGESVDKARIVTTKEDFGKLLSVTVSKSEDLGNQTFQLTIAVKNDQEFPVRMTNLSDMKTVVLLDKDGFSYPLPQPLVQGKDVTALGNSSTRIRYTFTAVEGEPAILRLYGTDIPVPKAIKTATGER